MPRLRRSLGLLSLALFTAAGIGSAAARDLQFGFTPVLGQSTMEEDFNPLMAYLARALGETVVLHIAKDYGSLRTEMESGSVDIGSFSPFAYVDAMRGGQIRIIAQSLIDGAASYRGIVIARQDSGLKRWADLRGKRFAYVDPKSASGYVYPRAMLIEAGFDPDHFFGSSFFAGDHKSVVAAVIAQEADAGATYDNAIRISRAAGQPTDELAILFTTDPIPHDAIAVRAAMDRGLARRIQAVLIAITQTPYGRDVIAENKKGLTGFAASTDATFDSVRRMAKAAGL